MKAAIYARCMKCHIAWSYLLFSFLAIPAWAEPSSTVRSLMNEPVSLFDLGLLRTKDMFRDLKVKGVSSVATSVRYDASANIIHIQAIASTAGKKLEKACIDVIKAIKAQLLINPETGNPIHGEASALGYFFTRLSADDREVERSMALGKELDHITKINTFVVNVADKGVNCSSKLRSVRITIGNE